MSQAYSPYPVNELGKEMVHVPRWLSLVGNSLTGAEVHGFDNSNYSCIIVQPVNFSAGPPGNQEILFRITPGIMGLVNQMVIEWTITETGGANSVTPVSAFFQLQYVNLYVNGQSGGRAAQQLLSESLFNSVLFMDQDQVNLFGAFNQWGINPNTLATPVAIPAAGSNTYSLPLMGLFCNRVDFQTTNLDMVLGFQFQQTGIVSAGAGVASLTNMRLKMRGRCSPSQDANLRSLIGSSVYHLGYLETQIQESTYALAPNVTTTIPFQLDGNIAMLTVMIRASKAVAASAISNFLSISGAGTTNAEVSSGFLDLQTRDGVSVFASGNYAPYEWRSTMPAMKGCGSTLTLAWPIYELICCDNIIEAASHGGSHGGVYSSGTNLQVAIRPGSLFNSGNLYVSFLAYVYAEQEQRDGRFFQVE